MSTRRDNKTMTVQELQDEKRQAEESIMKRLLNFTLRTGLRIRNVEVTPVEQAGTRSYIVDLDVDI